MQQPLHAPRHLQLRRQRASQPNVLAFRSHAALQLPATQLLPDSWERVSAIRRGTCQRAYTCTPVVQHAQLPLQGDDLEPQHVDLALALFPRLVRVVVPRTRPTPRLNHCRQLCSVLPACYRPGQQRHQSCVAWALLGDRHADGDVSSSRRRRVALHFAAWRTYGLSGIPTNQQLEIFLAGA